MKWVQPFAIGYEYVCIPDKVNNLIGNEANINRPSSYKRQSLEMSDEPNIITLIIY